MQTTRNARFSCGTTCGFCKFSAGNGFPTDFDKDLVPVQGNSFVGNCFLRIRRKFISAGRVIKSGGNVGLVIREFSCP